MAKAFGSTFTRHMAVSGFRDGAWSPVELRPLASLALHPAAHVLHYASTCFEGLKAYRRKEGGVHIFRLDSHAARMRNSARLLCLPVPETSLIEEIVCRLVAACADEVPSAPGALYLRPVLAGVDPNIGGASKKASEAMLYVVASPVGDYFGGSGTPLRLLVTDAMRTTPEFGQVKTGGNYAAALGRVIGAKESLNADQVLFCPGGNVQETGAANFLLLKDGAVLTKPLDGSILPGITRDSVLRLARREGYRVEERDFDVQEMLEWVADGEAALSGTAAVLAGVGTLIHGGRPHRVGNGQVGEQTSRLRERLTAIQTGEEADDFGWLRALGIT